MTGVESHGKGTSYIFFPAHCVPLTPIRCLYCAVDLFGNSIGIVSGDQEFTYKGVRRTVLRGSPQLFATEESGPAIATSFSLVSMATPSSNLSRCSHGGRNC